MLVKHYNIIYWIYLKGSVNRLVVNHIILKQRSRDTVVIIVYGINCVHPALLV